MSHKVWRAVTMLVLVLSSAFQPSYSQTETPEPVPSAKPTPTTKAPTAKAKPTAVQPGISFKIQMIGFEDNGYDGEGKELKFATVCAKFGRRLVAGFGPFKRGPINKVVCSNESDFGLDQPVDTQGKQSPSKSNQEWSLRIRNMEESIDFQVQYGADESFMVLSDFSFEKSFHPVALLNDKIQSLNIARMIIRALPFDTVITEASLSSTLDLPLRTSKNPKTPPKANQEILIYDLELEGGVLVPTPVASGALVTGAKGEISGQWAIQNGSGRGTSTQSGKGALLYVSRVKEKPANLKAIEDRMEKRQVKMKETFSSIGRSAYLGFRLGKAIGSDKSDFSRSTLYGIFGEFRSGIVSGLKIGYDVFPRATIEDETGSRFLSWSRTQIGYSFGTKLNLGLLNWVDVTPRLGVTTLDFGFEALDPDEFDSYSLIQRRSPTVGVEFGAEARGSKFLTRAWLYGTYSFGVLSVDKKFKTQALRSGVDFYYRLFNFGSVKVAGLVFGMTDYLKVNQLSFDDDDGLAVVELKSWLTYMGGGLTLAW